MKKNVIFIAYLILVFTVGVVSGIMGYDLCTWQYWVLIFAVIFSYFLGRSYEYYSYNKDENDKHNDIIKIQIIISDDIQDFRQSVDQFVRDKDIRNIEYQSFTWEHLDMVDFLYSASIIYS